MRVPLLFAWTTAPYRKSSGWLGALLLAPALAAGSMISGVAKAACTDTFTSHWSSLPPAPFQNALPLGVGSSVNALISTMNTVNTAFLSPSSSFVSARGDAQPGQLGGGVWGRSVAGSIDSKSTTTSTIDTSRERQWSFDQGKIVGVDPVPGKGACEGKLSETYFGYQFGFDLATLNIGGSGANLHVGLTGGYFNSRTQDKTEELTYTRTFPDPVTLTSPAGSFKSDSQVAFYGLYATFTNGNFFADALVRQDLYLMSFNDPLNGLSDQAQNANGITAGGNIGYKIQLPSNWFIEPSAGALWSRVRADAINSPGANTLAFSGGLGITNEGTVKIDDIESILGRATLRIGTTVTNGDVTWQPFVAGTVFHEFAGEATATSRLGGPDNLVTNCPPAPAICPPGNLVPNPFKNMTMNTSTSRIGTFAQYGIGTTVVFGSSGWLGYGRFDYRTGEDIEGYSFNAGVRYHW
jgi:Autotransporter beta-domain